MIEDSHGPLFSSSLQQVAGEPDRDRCFNTAPRIAHAKNADGTKPLGLAKEA